MFNKTYRRILPQVLATAIESIQQIIVGFVMALPVILIAALTGKPNEHNKNEILSITSSDASWLSSMSYPILLCGTFLSGFLSDHLGRKRSMMLGNVPLAIGWLILYRATEIWHIFTGYTLLVFGTSLVRTTMMSFVGEICEPSVRGVLVGLLYNILSVGVSSSLILNTLMPWRKIAFVGFLLPFISAVGLCFIPETPQWLLSKNRTKEAQNSLCWLRGWVPFESIVQEFDSLKRQIERSKSCQICLKKQELKCPHPSPNLSEKFAELKRKRTLRPFLILIPMFFLTQFSGGIPSAPFIVQIFRAYESPVSPDKAAAMSSSMSIFASLVFLILIRFAGKRRLYLALGTFGIFLSSLAIACFGFICLPSGYNSFDQNQSFHLENPNLAYIPFVCLLCRGVSSSCGFYSTPWLLLSELFPFKSRGLCSGVATAFNFALGFISVKLYYHLETTLSLPGVSLMYSVFTGIGLTVVYFILPETEGRSLEDIELHFADNSKKLTDRKIIKSSTTQGDVKA